MRYELSESIEADLEAIADYIAEDNPGRAVSFIEEIETKFISLSKNPNIYQLRPEIGRAARMAIVGRYVILFRIHSDGLGDFVRIERVLHGGRDLIDTFTD